MASKTDYGTLITWNALTLICKIIGYPEFNTERLKATSHASAGKSEYIPSGLIDYGEFDIEILVASGNLDSLQDAMLAKTVSEMVLTDGNDIFTFDAFCTKVGKQEHDAQSPDIIKAKVTFSPAEMPLVTTPA